MLSIEYCGSKINKYVVFLQPITRAHELAHEKMSQARVAWRKYEHVAQLVCRFESCSTRDPLVHKIGFIHESSPNKLVDELTSYLSPFETWLK